MVTKPGPVVMVLGMSFLAQHVAVIRADCSCWTSIQCAWAETDDTDQGAMDQLGCALLGCELLPDCKSGIIVLGAVITVVLVIKINREIDNCVDQCFQCLCGGAGEQAQPQAQNERLLAQAEAQSRQRSERLRAEAEAASAKAAAQIQAAQIAGLRLDGVSWPSYYPIYDGIYTIDRNDHGASWPIYKKRDASSTTYLYRSVASKKWILGRKTASSGDYYQTVADIKSVGGPVPTGTQTWQTYYPVSKAYVARTFSVAEVTVAEVQQYNAHHNKVKCLEMLATPGPGWRCNLCKTSQPEGTLMKSCYKCQYDVCASCVARTSIDASTAVAIATDASPTASASTSAQALTGDLGEAPPASIDASIDVVISTAASPTAPASTSAFTSDLAEVLLAAKLDKYEDALRELGCAFPEDLHYVEEADLLEIGMKTIEMKRLRRVVAEYK